MRVFEAALDSYDHTKICDSTNNTVVYISFEVRHGGILVHTRLPMLFIFASYRGERKRSCEGSLFMVELRARLINALSILVTFLGNVYLQRLVLCSAYIVLEGELRRNTDAEDIR